MNIKKQIATLGLLVSTLAIFSLSAGANFDGNGSLTVENSTIDFSTKQEQTATLTIQKTPDFNPDRACITINNPEISTQLGQLPLGKFCYKKDKGFYKYGDRFWQNGARFLRENSTVTETEDQLELNFSWYYPTIKNLKQTSLDSNISAIFYESHTAKYGKITNGPNFKIENLPPYVSSHSINKSEIEPEETLTLNFQVNFKNPEEQDRFIVFFNRKTDNPLGAFEWREGKGTRLAGGTNKNGNQYVSSYSIDREVGTNSINYTFNIRYSDETPLLENINIEYLYQSNTYNSNGKQDSNKIDNYNSGWQNLGSTISIVESTGQETEEEPEDEEETPDTSLQAYCDLSIVDLDCSKFIEPSISLAPESGSKTIFVSPPTQSNQQTSTGTGTQNDPLTSLQKADELAEPGDVVIIHEGTYQDCLSYDDCYELELKTNNVTWIGNGEVNLVPSGRSPRAINIKADNINISNLNIIGFTGTAIIPTWAQTKSEALTGLYLEDIYIEMNPDPNLVPDGIGFYGYHNGATFKNVSIKNTYQGITSAKDINNLYLENVTIQNRDSQHTGSAGDAIGIESLDENNPGKNFIVANSHIKHADADGVDIKAMNALVINTIVEGAERNGIKLWKNGDIVNSIVRLNEDAGADGAVILGSSNLSGQKYRILNSIVTGYGYPVLPEEEGWGKNIYSAALYANNSTLEIINSVFTNNTKSINVTSNSQITLENNLLNPGTLDGNVIVSGDYYITSTDDLNSLDSHPNVSSSNNLPTNTNPDLNNDLHTNSSSPLINAGTNHSKQPEFDLNNTNRVKDSSIDIGPYEY